jgi:predicted dehydrogenase
MVDVAIEIARASAKTTPGDQDITTTDLGGKTPKGVLFFVNFAEGDGVYDHAAVIWGATDGTGEWSACCKSEDGQASTDNARGIETTGCICVPDVSGAGIDGLASFVSFITNGVRINWSPRPSQPYQILAVFFAGDDVQCKADNYQPNATSIDITTIGFQPDLVWAATAGRSSTGMNDGIRVGFGYQDGAGTPQEASMMLWENNGSGTANPESRSHNDQTVGRASASSWDWSSRFDSFDSQGMTAQQDNGTSSHRTGYFAVNVGAANSKVGTMDGPTATGNDAVTGIGWEPQFVQLLATFHDAYNTGRTDSRAGSHGVGAHAIG